MKLWINILLITLLLIFYSQYFHTESKKIEAMTNPCDKDALPIKNAGNIKRISELSDKLNSDMNSVKVAKGRILTRLNNLTSRMNATEKQVAKNKDILKEHQDIVEDMSRQAQAEKEQLQQEADDIPDF